MSEHNNPVVSSEETARSNELTSTDETRELETRHSDGITTCLLFNKSINEVWVEVEDHRKGESFMLVVNVSKGENPYDVFYSPYSTKAAREDAVRRREKHELTQEMDLFLKSIEVVEVPEEEAQ